MDSKAILLVFYMFIFCSVGSNDSIYQDFEKSGSIINFNSIEIRLRHLDAVNAIRQERGLSDLTISPKLNASADTHARDIFVQQRAWNFGSDSSSPLERAKIAGFDGLIRGENVSESFEGEVLVLQAWLNESLSRSVIMDSTATHLGFGWYQEKNGKIWWVQDIGEQR